MRLLTALVGVLLTAFAVDVRATTILDLNPQANVWELGNANVTTDTYTYRGSFQPSPSSFGVECFLDADSGDFNTPYGTLLFPENSKIEASSVFSPAGTVFGPSSSYANGADQNFYDTGKFVSGAVSGSNNYVGIEVADLNGNEHYGWVQYSIAAYSNNTTALVFDAGYVSDVPGVAVITGAVPEPSTVAAMLGGLCTFAGARRLRQRAAKVCA